MPTMSISGSPMELLGAAPGISVIDPATVLTRQWYFDGKFLRAEGFRLDQNYVRALVALSNQAVGSGVAYGFDVRLGSGDTLAVDGGLALAPSGRVVYLPSDVSLAIAELIARSGGTFDPASAQPAGPADFSRCPPDGADDPTLPVVPRPLYVLTAAAADALCGDEERFGKLCADACATETERSVAVDGVRFRVRELTLTLPTSRTVPFTARHLRSRVASAYYRAERAATPSMISGAGLRTSVWCRGADAVGGDEVPLAVLDRAGTVTSLVDQWAARRELVETSPQRSWQWRLAMRPLDVFLAQLLQFQCQLIDAPGDDEPGPGPDPCAEERGALRQVGAALGALTAAPAAAPRERIAVAGIPAAVFDRLGELRELVTSALAGGVASSSGSLLIDRGFVETPPGGYLPIDPAHDVTGQVRALFGPGVDLRLCTVRPDFVPEALQEAQHMERISLTKGLDDPDALEEVDVLVPGGVVGRTPTRFDAYAGRARILPGVLPDRGAEASAVALNAVARDRTETGWSWSLAAYGEASRQVGLVNLATTVLRAAGGRTAAAPPTARVTLTEETAHDAALTAPAVSLRLNREGTDARLRLERIREAREAGRDPFVADAALAADAQRPVVGWFDVDTDRGLHLLNVGQRTTLRLRATLYSRATTSPLLADAQIDGTATLTSRQPVPGGTDELWVTRVDGIVDTLVIAGDEVNDDPPSPVRNLELHWRVRTGSEGTRVLSVIAATDDRSRPLAAFSADAPFRHLTGLVGITAAAATGIETGTFQPVTDTAADGTRFRRLIDVALDASAGALDPGSTGRDLAESVISVIAAELTARDRENGFAALARERMFGTAGAGGSTITAATDWVMFHRRRTKDCTGAAPPTPVAVRRFRWYHVMRPAGGTVDLSSVLIGRLRPVDGGEVRSFARVTQPLDQLGIEPFTVVEFEAGATGLHSSAAELRAAWSSSPRGERLTVAAIATEGVGEGEATNRGRLRAATGAVSDLIDISGARYLVLTTIPPELQSVGIDGIIVTQGAAADVPVETTCAHVLRLNSDQFKRIVTALPGLGDLEEVLDLARTMDSAEPIVATFTGDDITNVDELQAWWPDPSRTRQAAFAVDRSIADDASEVEVWVTTRIPKLLEVISPTDRVIPPDGVSIDLRGCRALVLLEEVFG